MHKGAAIGYTVMLAFLDGWTVMPRQGSRALTVWSDRRCYAATKCRAEDFPSMHAPVYCIVRCTSFYRHTRRVGACRRRLPQGVQKAPWPVALLIASTDRGHLQPSLNAHAPHHSLSTVGSAAQAKAGAGAYLQLIMRHSLLSHLRSLIPSLRCPGYRLSDLSRGTLRRTSRRRRRFTNHRL